MTIMEIEKVARSFISEIYGKHFGYECIKSKEDRGYYTNNGYAYVSSGFFRATIVPQNFDFVIKTARQGEGDWQCDRECELYSLAEECGVEDFFCRPITKFNYSNHVFVVFQKVEMNEEEDSFWDAVYDDDTVSAEELGKIIRFLRSNDINDLHNENYGYYNNHLCITDYAGCFR